METNRKEGCKGLDETERGGRRREQTGARGRMVMRGAMKEKGREESQGGDGRRKRKLGCQ